MARIPVGETPDYLAGTQFQHNPGSFEEVVREAFVLEHGARLNTEIAVVVGLDHSRVSQLFSTTNRLKADTIQRVIGHLKSKRHRTKIIEAWNRECFGDDFDPAATGNLTSGRITEKTLKRVDRLIRESRYETAALVAEEGAKRTKSWVLRECFFDRAYFVRQRLDEPGKAMGIVSDMAKFAEARGDTRRLATAHLLRARILHGLMTTTLDEIEPIFEQAAILLSQSEPVPSPQYMLLGERQLANTRLNCQLKAIERGEKPLSQIELERTRNALLKRAKEKASYQERFGSYFMASHITLLLGDAFLANEYLDLAFRSGDIKNLNAMAQCGIMQARILMQTDPTEAIPYLRGVIEECDKVQDLYHKRIAEYELSRALSDTFL